MGLPDITTDVNETVRTNYVGFVSFTILVWDHLITFADEVEYIWCGRKGPIVYLFLFNRYFTPLGFIINLFAYLSPIWTYERCRHFIRYEGVTVALAVEVVGLMMFLRVKALYPGNKFIQYLLILILVFETGMNAWLISRGQPVVHNPMSGRTYHACTMIFDPSISGLASSSAWIPLLYDTIVFGLTINRALPTIRRKQASVILHRIMEDGLLYYSVIFCITLVLTIMIIAAPDGVKNILAQTEQLVTVAMMSRITISLKKLGHKQEILDDDVLLSPATSYNLSNRTKRSRKENIPLAFVAEPPTPPPVHVHETDFEQYPQDHACSGKSWPRESVF